MGEEKTDSRKTNHAVYRSNILGKPSLALKKPKKLKDLPEDKPIGKRVLFVANPVAGKKLVKRDMANILESLTLNDVLPTVYVTKGKGDSTKFIREHGNEYDAVICSGGDGSLNEAFSGMKSGNVTKPLGYIPAGSTNIFAKCAGIPSDPVLAIEDMLTGRVREFDSGSFRAEGKPQRYFNYIAAFGAFSSLSYTTDQTLKNTIGFAAYMMDVVKDLDKIKPIHVRIEGEGDYQPTTPVPFFEASPKEGFIEHREGILEEGDYLFGVLSNADNIAGMIPLSGEDYDLQDGVFEVMLIRYPKNPIETTEMLGALAKEDYGRCALISFLRAKNLRFCFEEPVNWSLDGEMGEGSETVEFSVLPGALRLLTASTK